VPSERCGKVGSIDAMWLLWGIFGGAWSVERGKRERELVGSGGWEGEGPRVFQRPASDAGIKGKERVWCGGWVEMVAATTLTPPT
jgi:hypothetical protein